MSHSYHFIPATGLWYVSCQWFADDCTLPKPVSACVPVTINDTSFAVPVDTVLGCSELDIEHEFYVKYLFFFVMSNFTQSPCNYFPVCTVGHIQPHILP